MVVNPILARIVGVLAFVIAGAFLFNTFVVIEKRNPINILSADDLDDEIMKKLVLEYFRRKDDCQEVEEKIEIVDAGPEHPGQKARKISIIDSINAHIIHHYPESEKRILNPTRPILTCPGTDENLVPPYIKQHLLKHGSRRVLSEEDKKKMLATENYKLQEFVNKEIFKDEPGYFLEYRAYPKDVHESTTIHLEANLGWSGLRVDPSFAANETIPGGESYATGCVREDGKALSHFKLFNREQVFDAENGGIQKDFIPTTVLTKTGMDAKIQCFPLKSYMHADNRKHIDLLVLNSFGTELEILENAELKDISVKAVAVKTHKETKHKATKIRNLMKELGYTLLQPFSKMSYEVFHKI